MPSKPVPLALNWHGAALADEGRRAALARRALFDEGRAPSGLVSENVIDSWRRCQQAGLKPESTPVFEPINRSKAGYLAGRDHVLLKAAMGPFDELQASLAHSRCKVMLTDRAGVLLRATPQRAEDSALLRAASRPGVQLGELIIGTNAPGIAARSGIACEIGEGEHFYEMLRQIRCVAAPIRNRNGAVVAVLDLTIEDRPFGFNAAWLVSAYASAIENNLRIAQTRQQILLRLHPSPALLESSTAGLVAVDEQGRIGWLNDVAAALAGLESAHAGPLRCEETLGLDLRQVLELTTAKRPRPLLLPSELTVWVSGEFRKMGEGVEEHEMPSPQDAAAAEPAPSLAELSRRLIEQTLAGCGGNVSRAARMLGVSRGLLYRRLREEPGQG